MLTREQEQVADEFALAHGKCVVETPYVDAPQLVVCTAPGPSYECITIRPNGEVRVLTGAGLATAWKGEEDS